MGHSLGGAILTKFAQEYPNLIRSLVLLNPAGFKKVSAISSLAGLMLNNLFYQVAFLEDPVLMQVLELLPKQKSSFTRDRLSQRWRESQQVGRNSAIEYFENISEKIPIGCFFSNWDFATQVKYLPSPKKTWWYRLKRSYFNTIMFGSQDAANLIDEFVKKK